MTAMNLRGSAAFGGRLAVLLLLLVGGGSCSSGCKSDESEALANGASDVVVVRQADGALRATPMHVQIGKFANWQTLIKVSQGREGFEPNRCSALFLIEIRLGV